MSERGAKPCDGSPVNVDTTVHDAVLVSRPKKDSATRSREQLEALAGIRDRLFVESMTVIGDTMKARDLDIGLERDLDPAYENMVKELGEEEAQKTYRVALAGWSKAADAPVFVKLAANMAIGIMKANAAEKGGSRVLNVGRILISDSAVPKFEEMDVESE